MPVRHSTIKRRRIRTVIDNLRQQPNIMARFCVQPAQSPAGSARRGARAGNTAKRRLGELFYLGAFLAC